MPLTEASITTRAADLLFDASNVTWPLAELRRWLNSGVRAIAEKRPDAVAVVSPHQLAPGVRQTLPTGGARLLDVTRNLGSNGLTVGRAVRICEMEHLQAYQPTWAQDTAATEVQNFMYDERYPRTFYVYPPAHATTPVYVELIYAGIPNETTGPTDPLPIHDQWENALLDYVMFRALSKDAELGALNQAAVAHQQAFVAALESRAEADFRSSPNRASGGGEPQRMSR